MLQTIEQDILEITKGIICHQVNCRGKMGAGLALRMRLKFPLVYSKYLSAYSLGQLQIGKIQIISVGENLFVCNVAAQDRYGRVGKFTDYTALRTCMKKLADYSKPRNHQIYIPYKMGCSLAGGDWNIVSAIIEEEIPTAIICKPPDVK